TNRHHALEAGAGGRGLRGIQHDAVGRRTHPGTSAGRKHEGLPEGRSVPGCLHARTIPSFGFVFHPPRVKSGISTGRLRCATDSTVAPTRLLSAAASETVMSVGRPSGRHLISR